jgi:hypothetical protein
MNSINPKSGFFFFYFFYFSQQMAAGFGLTQATNCVLREF